MQFPMVPTHCSPSHVRYQRSPVLLHWIVAVSSSLITMVPTGGLITGQPTTVTETYMLYCVPRTWTERETQFFNISCQITLKMFAISLLKLHCSSLNRLSFTRDFSSGKFLHLVYTMSCSSIVTLSTCKLKDDKVPLGFFVPLFVHFLPSYLTKK